MEKYSVIGLMSGTSGDGLDIAYCQFAKSNKWSYEILKCETVEFPSTLKSQLMAAHKLPSSNLMSLDVTLGQWMGKEVKKFCQNLKTKPTAVCSHGHTVFHQPEKGLSVQIGNGWWLAQNSELPAINDFRMLDISLGGQGAPLVPLGDKLLFHEYDFCMNLGGISNISMDVDGSRKAFDCTPFNGLLNLFAQKLGAEYDEDGNWAREGNVDRQLLENLNSLDYYQKSGAKSLGREDLESDFLPIISERVLTEKDILATLIEHYAIQISQIIRKNRAKEKPKILLSGGGAYNKFFLERLSKHLQNTYEIILPNQEVIEFKEALIFGFLGVLKMRGENNCLSSVTGAKEDSCGGTWYDYRPS